VTVALVADPPAVTVCGPGEEVIVYDVIGLPPLSGGVQLTVADAFPAVAVTPVGAPGTVGAGMTVLDGADSGPVPTEFVAVTVKKYTCPFVRPVMVVLVTGGSMSTTFTTLPLLWTRTL
jgi:hypothetical protein